MRKSALSLGLHGAASGLILAALLLIAAPASALNLDQLGVDPIWFPQNGGTGGFWDGSAPAPTPDYVVNPDYETLCSGRGVFIAEFACAGLTEYELSIDSEVVLTPVMQFPQAEWRDPSLGEPLVVDTLLTVRNNTDIDLRDVILIFRAVNLEDFPDSLVPGGYWDMPNTDPTATSSGPASAFGLGMKFLKIMEEYDGTDYHYYGVGELGDLDPGETTELTVRYIVNNGPMPVNGNNVVLPPLRVLGVTVPEPSTTLLLGSGLLGLVVAGRRRW